MHLFTYGSLMFPVVWQQVVGRPFPGRPASLSDFAARSVSGESYPMLVPCEGVVTAGVLYSGLDEEALARLDRFEGESYCRIQVQTKADDGAAIAAWTYVAANPDDPAILAETWDATAFARDRVNDFVARYAPSREQSAP